MVIVPESDVVVEQESEQSEPANNSRAKFSLHSSFPYQQSRASAKAEPKDDLTWKSYTVKKGDTLGRIFDRHDIDVGLASKIVEQKGGATLKKLLPKHDMQFGYDSENTLRIIRYEVDRTDELVVEFKGESFTISERKIPTEIRERVVSQTIYSSLFEAGYRAGLSDKLITKLASVFGWDIDFVLDIRTGDRFSVIYEELVREGETVGVGDIVAAEFINAGATYQAFRHVDPDGHTQYYDSQGNARQGAFLKTPVRFSRITSGFSKNRFHPVLKKWRAHKGVDYAAPRGTPVVATADGKVHFVGRNGGYGKTIVLRHGRQFSTLYAHLSGYGKGMSHGAKVQQGDVIGYVGTTGLATGPHLHYEFRVNDVHRDPLTYETPKAQPIAEEHRGDFVAMAREHLERISVSQTQNVASN